MHTDVVVTVLVLGATGVALAGGLTETIDAKLVADTIPRASTKGCKNMKFRKFSRIQYVKLNLLRNLRSFIYQCIFLHCKLNQ